MEEPVLSLFSPYFVFSDCPQLTHVGQVLLSPHLENGQTEVWGDGVPYSQYRLSQRGSGNVRHHRPDYRHLLSRLLRARVVLGSVLGYILLVCFIPGQSKHRLRQLDVRSVAGQFTWQFTWQFTYVSPFYWFCQGGFCTSTLPDCYILYRDHFLSSHSHKSGKWQISNFGVFIFFANSLIFKKETSGKLMNESFAICELFLLVEKEFPMLEKFHICRTFDQVYISGLSSSPLGGGSFTSSNTKCPVCSGAFVSPKVLPCFHTFCQPCLERCQVGLGLVMYQLQSCVFHYPQKVLFKSKIKIF